MAAVTLVLEPTAPPALLFRSPLRLFEFGELSVKAQRPKLEYAKCALAALLAVEQMTRNRSVRRVGASTPFASHSYCSPWFIILHPIAPHVQIAVSFAALQCSQKPICSLAPDSIFREIQAGERLTLAKHSRQPHRSSVPDVIVREIEMRQ